jgi:hypothetical protein
MERKFIQWWSTISATSAKRTTTFRLNLLNAISVMINRFNPFCLILSFFCRDRMVVGFTTIYAISATGRWFSPGPPISLINKTGLHYITEILLKVALNTINQPTNQPTNKP